MPVGNRDVASAAGLWIASVAVALALRPLLPVDETRYLAVAWEMWQSGDYLVPHLNGLPYSHKPPLIFWLVCAGWALFGVSETVARTMTVLPGLATLIATAWLARVLWPRDSGLPGTTAYVFAGYTAFTLFGSMVMFDSAVACATVLGIAALWKAANGDARWWLGFALAIAIGCLAKGPVVLAFLVPTAFAAPIWAQAGLRLGRWYAAATAATVLGLLLIGAWALPAAGLGGPEYANAILWKQTSGRVVRSFAHRQPWWYYAAVLPVLLYPWGWWPATWRQLAGKSLANRPLRLVAVWFVSSVAVLSMVSGKQLHYLLPIVPAAALGIAVALQAVSHRSRLTDVVGPLAPIGLIGVALLVAPMFVASASDSTTERYFPQWFAQTAPWLGAAILVTAVSLTALLSALRTSSTVMIACLSLFIFMLGHVLAARVAFDKYDLDDLAALLRASDPAPIAVVGSYDGEFTFLARLARPVATLAPAEAPLWLAANPQGQVVVRYRERPSELPYAPRWEQPYRGKWLGVWTSPTSSGRRS